MKKSLKVGVAFGVTSGIITTLGLLVGLTTGTNSKLAVIGGILTIAVVDAMSDAFGIHVSEESEKIHKPKEVWESTFATFLSKLAFALTFMVPVLLFSLSTAMAVSVIWGLLLLSALSFVIAKEQKAEPWRVVGEHLLIALAIIAITACLGSWVAVTFG